MSIETLRPNAAGDVTDIAYQEPNSTAHWDKVDDSGTSDESTTYVYSEYSTIKRDLYNLPNPSCVGPISKIKVYTHNLKIH